MAIRGSAYSIIGFKSYGKGCELGTPGAYTNVSLFLDWIESRVWPLSYKSLDAINTTALNVTTITPSEAINVSVKVGANFFLLIMVMLLLFSNSW